MKNELGPDGTTNKNGNELRGPIDSASKGKEIGKNGKTTKVIIPKNSSSSKNSISKNILDVIDLVCFSHLRWNFVFQRPQHLLTRFAKKQRVFHIEEPIFDNPEKAYMEENTCSSGVKTIVPHLPSGLSEEQVYASLKNLVDDLFERNHIKDFIEWYYTPMALPFSRHLKPRAIVYDCMDELSMFKGAHPNLLKFEEELLNKADVVFTGGMKLYEHKKNISKHKNIHGFPSSIDVDHFSRGVGKPDPQDQANIPHPRVGFSGVIDERMNVELVGQLAKLLPEWQFIMIGPVVKISPDSLPKESNIHYLGGKKYEELPEYLANWDVAMLPFALNDSTKFISPTKTPEYLAAGRSVVSTSITDVVKPYEEIGLVHIADNAEEFAEKIKLAYQQLNDDAWKEKVKTFLSQNSWDKTWSQMRDIIERAITNDNNSEHSEKHINGDGNIAAKEEENWIGKLDKFFTLDSWDKTWNQVKSMISSALPDSNPSMADCIEKSINSCMTGGTLMFDYLVVGAGYAGSVLAERLAKDGKKVLIIDKRDHIGGNAYDYYNEDGILIHKYGPHIFHTNSKDVFEYLSQFTKWRNYEHRVLASVDGQLLPIPINLDTINKMYGFNLNSTELEKYFESVAEHRDPILTSEDVVVSKVGRELYEKFFRGYTKKQWDLDPSELNASVTARVPTRTNRDDRYFTDHYQAMPLHGYTEMFKNMLAHPNIKIMLNTDYKDIINIIPYKEMVFTGPIDEFFNFQFGKLPYRSLDFVFETHDKEWYQTTGTVNYPNDTLFTRISEFKYLSGQQHPKTTIVYEYPKAEGDPYYPIPRAENYELYKKYEKLAEDTRPDVHFVGRLATYKYYNMDQVVAQALAVHKKIQKQEEENKTTNNSNNVKVKQQYAAN